MSERIVEGTALGRSEGNGDVDGKTLKYLTTVFEKELIYNIDKKTKHDSHIESE